MIQRALFNQVLNEPKREFFGFNNRTEKIISKQFNRFVEKELKKSKTMSVRENIASNLLSTISGISSPINKESYKTTFYFRRVIRQTISSSYSSNI